MSRDMTNTIILEPLRLLKKDRVTLSRSTQAVVRQNREENALSMDDADFVRDLAKQWLQGNSEKYLNTNQSRLLWPKDTERLTEIIADLMSLQNLRRAKEEGSPRSVPQREVKDLETWPQPRSKRLCTQQDIEHTSYAESPFESAILPSSDTYHSIHLSPEQSQPLSAAELEKSQHNNTEHTRSSDATVLRQFVEQDTQPGPLQGSRAREQLQASSPAPVPTIALTASFEPAVEIMDTDAPITPLSPIERKRRAISECTNESPDETTFKVDCNGKTYEIPGQKCANVLQLTLSLLEQMRADLRVAMLQRKALDNQTKVAHILGQIEEALKQ